MFKSAVVRLTALYIGILAAISIFFSYNWYTVATDELNKGLRQQAAFVETAPGFVGRNKGIREVLDERREEFEEGKRNIAFDIAVANVIVLVLGGLGSFVLARRTLKPIEQAHNAQSRFTADASHELRTPLAAMQTEIEVALRDKKLKIPEAKQLLNSNLEELSKLTGLSASLLKLARQDSNGNLKQRPAELKKIVKMSINRTKKQAKQRSVTLTDKTDLAKVMADKSAIEEVLVILLDNAIKYSSKGQEVIVNTQETKHHVKLFVEDHGIGIKAGDQEHIFDRFYRADASRGRHKAEGHGLGLSIAQNIAKLHKTKVEVKSEPGKGSEFSINLEKA